MPSIDIAMARSVATKRTLLDVFASAMGPVLHSRDDSYVSDKITDVKTAFSSWGNCMQADFCKWPVIAVIIVGGLVLLSICCGDCCGCCDPPRGKRNKYLDEPYIPPHQGYRPEAPMATSLPYKPPVQSTPQYANFDVSKTAGHEDALPAMPSWETANSKKVYLEEEVEMDNLKKPDGTGQSAPLLNTNAGNMTPGHNTPSPLNSPSPVNHYGPPHSPGINSPMGPGGPQAVDNGFMAAGAMPPMSSAGSASGSGPYGRGGPGYSNSQPSSVADYGAEMPGNDSYGGYGPGGAMGPGRQTPRPYNNINGNPQPGYGGPRRPHPNQQGGGAGGGGYYDDYRRNGNNTPPSYGNMMDRRAPRVPEIGGMDNRSPRIPDIGMMDNRSPRIPDVGGMDSRSAYNPDNRSPRIPDVGGMDARSTHISELPSEPSSLGRYASPAPFGDSSPRPPANGRPPVNAMKPMSSMGSMNSSSSGMMNTNTTGGGRSPPPRRPYPGPAMDNASTGYDNVHNTNNVNNVNDYPAEMPASPTIQNSGGFDFLGDQGSRPSARPQNSYGSSGHGSRPLNQSSASPPPLQQPQPQRAGYQEHSQYRAYRN
ncbi:hypothetical protein SEPCBS57363_000368 [Sporothrix epigloea]|uniref:Fibroin-3 related protein n=1 Tax=Sporothrix epigloea TaxID=1892477 RepID=A0ABP0D4B4_9PEZI